MWVTHGGRAGGPLLGLPLRVSNQSQNCCQEDHSQSYPPSRSSIHAKPPPAKRPDRSVFGPDRAARVDNGKTALCEEGSRSSRNEQISPWTNAQSLCGAAIADADLQAASAAEVRERGVR